MVWFSNGFGIISTDSEHSIDVMVPAIATSLKVSHVGTCNTITRSWWIVDPANAFHRNPDVAPRCACSVIDASATPGFNSYAPSTTSIVIDHRTAGGVRAVLRSGAPRRRRASAASRRAASVRVGQVPKAIAFEHMDRPTHIGNQGAGRALRRNGEAPRQSAPTPQSMECETW